LAHILVVKGLTYLYSHHLHLDEWFLVRLLGQILELLGHGPVVTPLKYALSSCLFVKVLYTTMISNLNEILFVRSLLQAGVQSRLDPSAETKTIER